MAIGTEKDSQKKMIGELLKAADRYIKSADWQKALDEVGKALAIEPNNMYAMAYKDRINVSLSDEKKKAEDEKVKKLAEEKKGQEKPAEAPAEEKKPDVPVPPEPPKAEEKKPEPPKAETPKAETPKPVAAPAPGKDDSTARIDSLRQEFTATQAKLQREVAQLTMQVREAQALKEATEKNLNAQIAALQQELNAAKQHAAKGDPKELEALKAKFQKDVESAKEIARAEMLTQVAVLQKELEAAKLSAAGTSLKQQGEQILKNMFQRAWQDGTVSNDERALLLLLKGAIEMTESKFGEMEASSKSDAYINALRAVWSDGVVTPDESDFLTSLREKLGIPADEHFRLEGQIRKEVKK
jgi:hypothetical protein